MSARPTSPHVLISGAGIAGTALALQLVRSGMRTTVVERDETPRTGGQSVDLRGASAEVVDRLGLMPAIRRHQLDERGLAYVDGRGRVYGRMSMEAFDGQGAVAEIEIARGDLCRLLLDELATADAAHPGLLTHRWGDRMLSLTQDEDGVDVQYASGDSERVDLVVGADGAHSATRRLVFGSEDQYATYLGGYTAFFTMPTPADIEPGWFAMRSVPGATFGIRPGADPTVSMALITIRMDRDPSLRGDRERQENVIRHALAEAGWHAPAVLEAMTAAGDFYFDELDRIDVPTPVRGRVALLGDAASSGSPMSGMGTATALIGAYLLAHELTAAPADVPAALGRYAKGLTPFAEAGTVLPGGGIRFMVAGSGFAHAVTRVTMGLMLSRAFRPLVRRMYLAGATEHPPLPAPTAADVRV